MKIKSTSKRVIDSHGVIDFKIFKLTNVMNNYLPDLVIMGSCGGHVNSKERDGQLPSGEFGVSFWIKPTKRGFKSLELVTRAAMETDYRNIKVMAWINGFEENGILAFDLEGKNNADPNKMADILFFYVKK